MIQFNILIMSIFQCGSLYNNNLICLISNIFFAQFLSKMVFRWRAWVVWYDFDVVGWVVFFSVIWKYTAGKTSLICWDVLCCLLNSESLHLLYSPHGVEPHHPSVLGTSYLPTDSQVCYFLIAGSPEAIQASWEARVILEDQSQGTACTTVL